MRAIGITSTHDICIQEAVGSVQAFDGRAGVRLCCVRVRLCCVRVRLCCVRVRLCCVRVRLCCVRVRLCCVRARLLDKIINRIRKNNKMFELGASRTLPGGVNYCSYCLY